MSSHPDYAARIRAMHWDDLRGLWARIRAGHTPGWPAGKAFEYLVLRAFELDGAEVVWPFRVYHGSELVEEIDGAVYAAGLSCIVEAKDTAALVDVGALAKLRSQLARRPAAALGLFFSRSGFTDGALTLVTYFAPQTVLLWTGADIGYVLESERIVEDLTARYRGAVENGPAYRRLEFRRRR